MPEDQLWWLAAWDSDERRLAGHGVARVEDLGTRVGGRGARAVHPLYGVGLVVEPQKNHRVDGFQVWATKPGCCGFAEFGPQNSGRGPFPGLGLKTWVLAGF